MNMGEKIARLPKWAQEHIADIKHDLTVTLRALNKYLDTQTKSSIYVDNLHCTGEERGPSQKRHYIQSHKINVDWKGVHLSIICREGQDEGINLQWWRSGCVNVDEIAMIPKSHQSVVLKDIQK